MAIFTPLSAGEIIRQFRAFLAEPYQTRWLDQPGQSPTSTVQVYNSTLELLSNAQREIARETRWLSGRYAVTIKPNIQEYGLPDIVGIRRVYMMTATGPQRLTRTSIPQMEGDQQRLYDQTGANYTPQWMVLPAAPYPIANTQLGAGWSPIPMFPGQRPQWYLREPGNIGVVPVNTIVSFPLVIDVTDFPQEVQALDDISPFARDFKEPIAYYMCKLAYFSDQAVGSDSLEAAALVNYEQSLAKRQSFIASFEEEAPQGPQILTHRTFFGARAGYGSDY